ncbi:MAG: DUF4190 domain-containing protein [Chloroflexi bacterium]|nr:DUF4190 domain-containing protein [Chloroflexota bacterium]
MDQSNQPINYGTPPTSLPTSVLAIVSLVAGILGFGVFPLIGSIAAIVTGYLARQETRSVPPRASGDGMATAGIIMGIVQLVLGILAVCCFIAYFVFVIGYVSTSQ